ncbi:hypothetical protein ACT7DA_08490 [Bacillus pacificus]
MELRNRVIIYTCGGMLIVLGFIQKSPLLQQSFRNQLLGGAMLAMFSM